MRISTKLSLGLGLAVLAAVANQVTPSGEVDGMALATWLWPAQKDLASPTAVQEAIPPAVVTPLSTLDPQYRLPDSAIASGNRSEPFGPRGGRFWKVPRNLVPIYEEAARDYRIPVRYLAANGSFESLFDSTRMGDGKRSCGIHQFHDYKSVNGKPDWTVWGFSSLEECQDPKANIRMTARIWRARIDNTDLNAHCNGLLSCAIRLHKGWGANAYMHTVMAAADRSYRFE